MTLALMAIFFGGIGLVILGSMQFYMILGEVNGKLELKDRIGPLFVNYRLFEVLRLHKIIYPESRARVVSLSAIFAGIFVFFVAFIGGIAQQSL